MGASKQLIGALFSLILLVNMNLKAQYQSLPPGEARNAIESLEREPEVYDSLRQVFNKKWTIGVSYGLRFIAPGNQTEDPDTITFADFNNSRVVFGMHVGKFITSRLQLGLLMQLLILPREQELGSIQFNSGGVSVEGSGNGGGMLNWGLNGKYYLVGDQLTRPYVSGTVGVLNARAAGGEGGFSSDQGSFQDFNELRERYGYLQLTGGVIHRLAPITMLDFNIGYTISNQSDPIGGMTSPGGFTSNVSFHFIFGKK